MSIELYDGYNNSNLVMLEELYSIFNIQGNIHIIAFFKTFNKMKVYYDFQHLNQPMIKGSYDKLEVLEFIFYLENK